MDTKKLRKNSTEILRIVFDITLYKSLLFKNLYYRDDTLYMVVYDPPEKQDKEYFDSYPSVPETLFIRLEQLGYKLVICGEPEEDMLLFEEIFL